eukprot:TRINITY_DN3327_c3_g1_i1.p1 TRINITY_DN3327_c3_g1~~TRINITY_DN3327_c3_g1_i1.p1  ORF type:complete len:405 (-),score=82.86 TRINITY_DN3327_c3_g1_i1:287-1501(-)
MFFAKLSLHILCVVCSVEQISSVRQSLVVDHVLATSVNVSNVRVRDGNRVVGHQNLERLRVYGVQADEDGKCRDVMNKVKAFLERDDAEGRSDAAESKEEQDILSGERSSKVLDEIEDVISRSDFERQLEVGEVITSGDLNHLVECELGNSSVRLEEMTAADANLEEDEDLFEGDIIVHKGHKPSDSLMQLNSSEDADGSQKWSGMLWPGGKIPFCFHKDAPQNVRNTFRQAVQQFARNSCVKWEEIEAATERKCTQRPSVMVKTYREGCNSYVGLSPRLWNSQGINYGWGCHSIGTILHEMGHAIGMAHEHVRWDRDEYITVHWENIIRKWYSAFRTQFLAATSDPYDYSSLMHYGPDAFSEEGKGYAITGKDGKIPRGMGQRAGFSRQDWAQINKMYSCKGR